MYNKPQFIVITENDLKNIKVQASSSNICRASGACVGTLGGGCVATPQQGI